MVVEIRLWVFILFEIAFFLMLINTIFGDLIGKALCSYLEHKEKKYKERLAKKLYEEAMKEAEKLEEDKENEQWNTKEKR